MKKVLITAGGTATAWHIVCCIEKYFCDTIEAVVCDINEPYLVPASTKVPKYYKVPFVNDNGYLDAISEVIVAEKIDYIIPLIPQEALLFAKDSDFVNEHKIGTLVPYKDVIMHLANKKNMYETLLDLNIPTPKVCEIDDIDREMVYMAKPVWGFGSQKISIVSGRDLINTNKFFEGDEFVVQEYCTSENFDEVTVEVYNGKDRLCVFARRRVAVKAGVCVKMEPVDEKLFLPYIKKIVDNIECPIVFNVQFLFHENEWKLFDCNLRLGAGTALATASGFQLTRAMLSYIAGLPVEDDLFFIDKNIKSVLRVYQEVVVR